MLDKKHRTEKIKNEIKRITNENEKLDIRTHSHKINTGIIKALQQRLVFLIKRI
jgi:hypothetical protein